MIHDLKTYTAYKEPGMPWVERCQGQKRTIAPPNGN